MKPSTESTSLFDIVIKHSPKYLTGSIISSGVGLLMTKYYTHVFDPSAYGILALYLVMFKYIVQAVSLNMDAGATRFYFDYRDSRRNEFLSTIFWFITSMALIVGLIGLALLGPVSNWISPGSEFVYLATLGGGILAVYVSFLTRVLYNEHKSNSVLGHAIFQTAVNHLSSFLFISVANFGIFGRLLGQGIGFALNMVSLGIEHTKKSLFKLKMTFNSVMAKETFLFSLPGVITNLQNILFVYLDRIFLKIFRGDFEVGIYSLGYMLGQGLSIVYESVFQAVLPKVFTDLNKNYDRAIRELEHFAIRYYLAIFGITIIVSLLSEQIVLLFSNRDFIQSASIIPLIMGGFMLGGFYKVPAMLLSYHKKVWIFPFLSFFSFGSNGLLNYLLIPGFGVVGAAGATFVGLFLYSLVLQIYSMRFNSRKYKIQVVLLYIFVFTLAMLYFLLRIWN